MDVLTAEKLAEVLQEPNVLLLKQVLRVLGEATLHRYPDRHPDD